MKHSSAELKQMARNNLTGKWGIVIGLTLLEILFTIILSTISIPFSETHTALGMISYLLVTLITGLISGLFSAGSTFFFLNICRNREYQISDLFAAFRMHPDRFLIVSLILTAAQLVFTVPAQIFSFTNSAKDYYLVFLTAFLCSLLGSIVSLILSLFFGQSTYLLLDFPEMGAIESMKCSAKLMRGNKGRYFYIFLSFLGWFFLGVLSCGIGYLWILPYASMTFTNFYLDISQQMDPTDTL